jgi:L-rhamnose mutarotase
LDGATLTGISNYTLFIDENNYQNMVFMVIGYNGSCTWS